MVQRTSTDIIFPNDAVTLSGLFKERVRRTPDRIAYRYYDEKSSAWCERTWAEMANAVGRWQAALEDEQLEAGDRVAVMMCNCTEWVMFEQAALALGLVVIPLYTNDRAENVGYILENASVKLLVIQGSEQWEALREIPRVIESLRRVVSVMPIPESDCLNFRTLDEWLPQQGDPIKDDPRGPDELATIVYTSGTTGRPKGVMLSHRNILWNAYAAQQSVPCFCEDLFLSFLPLSHTFERTAGYYSPMMGGATVAFARSVTHLAEDLLAIRPTALISVPRIFECVALKVKTALQEKGGLALWLFNTTVEVGWKRFQVEQKRERWTPVLLLWPLLNRLVARKVLDKFGGRIRLAVCGGAPLSQPIAKVFIGLGLPLIQGYGLTESSPIICANTFEDNDPVSIGVPLVDVEVKISETGELLARSPGVMLGYWGNDEATRQVIDSEGWLHTGDKARIANRHIYITGRVKDIIVLANGEKVPPADMEAAVSMDVLFDQVMVIGEGRPYLSALAVVNPVQWDLLLKQEGIRGEDATLMDDHRLEELVLARISAQLHEFPGYAKIRRVALISEPWTVNNGLLTPTLKVKRNKIAELYRDDIDALYRGH